MTTASGEVSKALSALQAALHVEELHFGGKITSIVRDAQRERAC